MSETKAELDAVQQAREDDAFYAEWTEPVCRNPAILTETQRAIICDALFPSHGAAAVRAARPNAATATGAPAAA